MAEFTNPPVGTRGHIRIWLANAPAGPRSQRRALWQWELQLDDDPLGRKLGGFSTSSTAALNDAWSAIPSVDAQSGDTQPADPATSRNGVS